jgi:hypothetical protein
MFPTSFKFDPSVKVRTPVKIRVTMRPGQEATIEVIVVVPVTVTTLAFGSVTAVALATVSAKSNCWASKAATEAACPSEDDPHSLTNKLLIWSLKREKRVATPFRIEVALI